MYSVIVKRSLLESQLVHSLKLKMWYKHEIAVFGGFSSLNAWAD